jgi:hypothetical protein
MPDFLDSFPFALLPLEIDAPWVPPAPIEPAENPMCLRVQQNASQAGNPCAVWAG